MFYKERILKANREKKTAYKGNPIRLALKFSTETLQAKKEWKQTFKILKEGNYQLRII